MRKSLRLGAKTSLYLLTSTGLAAFAYQSLNTTTDSIDSPYNFINSVVRPSRAIFTITSCVVDYKYTLHGLPVDSDECRRTLSETVPCNFEAIKEVICKSLGKDLSEIFLSFNEQPFAAASIAQVHHALLKNNQEVAVKVQYPGLEYQMNYDLATLTFLSRSVTWSAGFHGWYQNLRSLLLLNLDLTSSKVLTMEFCEGRKIDDLEFLKKNGISPLEITKVLVEVFAEMIFVHGFGHGDPHPGNILVCPTESYGFSLVLLDHGIYKHLTENFRMSYCYLWEALILLDSQKIQELGETFGVGKYSRYFPVIFTERTIHSKSVLGRRMSPEEKKHHKEDVKSLKLEGISSFMESLPPDFLTVLRTDGLLRSLISKLGAPQQIRLIAYAKCALRGLSRGASSKSDFWIIPVSRFKASMKYIKLRFLLEMMEFVAYMDDIRRSLKTSFIQLISSARYLIWNLRRLVVLTS